MVFLREGKEKKRGKEREGGGGEERGEKKRGRAFPFKITQVFFLLGFPLYPHQVFRHKHKKVKLVLVVTSVLLTFSGCPDFTRIQKKKKQKPRLC